MRSSLILRSSDSDDYFKPGKCNFWSRHYWADGCYRETCNYPTAKNRRPHCQSLKRIHWYTRGPKHSHVHELMLNGWMNEPMQEWISECFTLQMDKLSSRPSWLNQMFTRSEVCAKVGIRSKSGTSIIHQYDMCLVVWNYKWPICVDCAPEATWSFNTF